MPRLSGGRRSKDEAEIPIRAVGISSVGRDYRRIDDGKSARSQSASASNSEIYSQLELFGEVLERVNSGYVEKPDNSKLIEAAINGMLSSLDPHSTYLNPKQWRDMQVERRRSVGWYRGHHGERRDQGRVANRGHACC